MTLRRYLRQYGDVTLAVGLAGLFVLSLLTWPHAELAATMPAGIASALALGFRRRSPLASFIVCLACDGVVQYADPAFNHESYAVLAIFLINLYSLGAYARGTEAWLSVGGLVVAVVILARGDGDVSAGGIAFYVAMCGMPWGIGAAFRLRAERVAEVEAHNALLREEAARAVADERARIARELHDVVSHAIAVTVLQARGGRRMLGRDEESVRRALGAIEQTNTAALADMRRLLALLRADDDLARDEPAPSLDRLPALVDQVRTSGLPVEFDIGGEALPLPPGLETSAYRIVQEALTNVLKHGGPRARAHVTVDYSADALDIAVTNDGEHPDGNGTGHGLIGIRERVTVAGGTLDVGPTGTGYTVRATLPYLTALAPAEMLAQ